MSEWEDLGPMIQSFVDARGWEPFHDPKSLAMGVVSEAGELAAELRWVPTPESDGYARRPEVHERLRAEVADIAITLFMFCARTGIDLPEAMRDKMERNHEKYPEPFLPSEEPDWTFIPLAGRRALDHAGLKLSLKAWQALPLMMRSTIVSCGIGDVDPDTVIALLAEADPAPAPLDPPLDVVDPPDDEVPELVTAALAPDRTMSIEEWTALEPLARYALYAYARRGKADRVAEVYDGMFSDLG